MQLILLSVLPFSYSVFCYDCYMLVCCLQCASNGMMYNRLRQEGLSCITLEMFFGSYPRMVGLNHFPNLQVLRIVGQAVRKIDGLRFLPKLKELWIIECSLKVSECSVIVDNAACSHDTI